MQLVVLLRRLGRSVSLCRRLDAEYTGALVVLDDDRPEAYALAGLPGRTVVTRAMLQALSGPERRALLAHEQSHVSGYHFVYVSLVQLAAAANPLLRPLVPATRSRGRAMGRRGRGTRRRRSGPGRDDPGARRSREKHGAGAGGRPVRRRE